MKITLEQAELSEPEVIIRGDLNDPRVRELILAAGGTTGVSKLILYRDDKEYPRGAEEIHYFSASGGKVFAHIGAEQWETRYKLYELAALLQSKGFVQINKSVVVNVQFICSVEAEFSGNYIALLRDQRTRLVISRSCIKQFRTAVLQGK